MQSMSDAMKTTSIQFKNDPLIPESNLAIVKLLIESSKGRSWDDEETDFNALAKLSEIWFHSISENEDLVDFDGDAGRDFV